MGFDFPCCWYQFGWDMFFSSVKNHLFEKKMFGEFCLLFLVVYFNHFQGIKSKFDNKKNWGISPISLVLVRNSVFLKFQNLYINSKLIYYIPWSQALLWRNLHNSNIKSWSGKRKQNLFPISWKIILKCFIVPAVWHTLTNILDVNYGEVFVALLIFSNFPIDDFSPLLMCRYCSKLERLMLRSSHVELFLIRILLA